MLRIHYRQPIRWEWKLFMGRFVAGRFWDGKFIYLGRRGPLFCSGMGASLPMGAVLVG